MEIKILINMVEESATLPDVTLCDVLNILYILGCCIIFAFIYYSLVHKHLRYNNYYPE